MVLYQKTMFDRYHCIKSFCHLKTLEKRSEKFIFALLSCAQMHEIFVGLKEPVLEQKLTSSIRH